MSRKSREISPTGVYHVMLRGINRGRIFDDEQDCRKFVKILHQVTHPKDKDDVPLPPFCSIYAYCLMDNHIHLTHSRRHRIVVKHDETHRRGIRELLQQTQRASGTALSRPLPQRGCGRRWLLYQFVEICALQSRRGGNS